MRSDSSVERVRKYREKKKCNVTETLPKRKCNGPEREKEKKDIYGEFKNVLLTEEEFKKLTEKLNGSCRKYIERLSSYVASHGKKYKSHYAAILNFVERDGGVPKDKDKGVHV